MDLMIPRIKLIADYIGNTQPVGYVFETQIPHYYLKFPANFKRLEWWEERKPEDMPEYVKYKDGKIHKVNKHFINSFSCAIEFSLVAHYVNLTPSTKEEYESFINSKTQNHVK